MTNRLPVVEVAATDLFDHFPSNFDGGSLARTLLQVQMKNANERSESGNEIR
jgi:hypothetical protein